MYKTKIIIDENNRIKTQMVGPYSSVNNNNEFIIDNNQSSSILGALFDPVTKSFTFDEEYDAIQTAMNTPPEEPVAEESTP